MGNYAAYVHERLLAQGFVDVRTPSGQTPGFLFALHRVESWGRLLVVLADAAHALDSAKRGSLVLSMAGWAEAVAADVEQPCYVLLALPFLRRVDETEAAAIRGLQQEAPDQRWGVIPWVVDLETELVDRHAGFPPVGDEIAQILTDLPLERADRPAIEPAERRPQRRAPARQLGHMPVSYGILVATIAYYLLSTWLGGGLNALIQGPSNEALLLFGANYSYSVIDFGQQWRLLSSMFLHAGILHIGMNMWAFWQIGRYTELLFGSGRMSFIYLVAGVCGSLASVSLRAATFSLGASGAIMGLMGALLYYGWTNPGRINLRGLATPVVINLAIGFLIPGVDNLAHIGGLVGGFAAAFIAGVPGQKGWRSFAMSMIVLLILLLLADWIPVPYLHLFN
ncbi:MAG: rhomboid family intramembrane serine protease [Mycobacterium leprae]